MLDVGRKIFWRDRIKMQKQPLLNTYVNNVTLNETIEQIEWLIADKKKSYVVAINVDVVIKIENDEYLKNNR